MRDFEQCDSQGLPLNLALVVYIIWVMMYRRTRSTSMSKADIEDPLKLNPYKNPLIVQIKNMNEISHQSCECILGKQSAELSTLYTKNHDPETPYSLLKIRGKKTPTCERVPEEYASQV